MSDIIKHINTIENIQLDVKYLKYDNWQDVSMLRDLNRNAYAEILKFRPDPHGNHSKHFSVWTSCEDDLRYQEEKEYDLIYKGRGKVKKGVFDKERNKLYDILDSYSKGLRSIAANDNQEFDEIKKI